MADYLHGLTWDEACAIALLGARIRRNGWRRWIASIQGSKRAWETIEGDDVRHTVWAEEFTVEEFLARDWTTAPWPGEPAPPNAIKAQTKNVPVFTNDLKVEAFHATAWREKGNPSEFRVGIASPINTPRPFAGSITADGNTLVTVGLGGHGGILLSGLTLVGNSLAGQLRKWNAPYTSEEVAAKNTLRVIEAIDKAWENALSTSTQPIIFTNLVIRADTRGKPTVGQSVIDIRVAGGTVIHSITASSGLIRTYWTPGS